MSERSPATAPPLGPAPRPLAPVDAEPVALALADLASAVGDGDGRVVAAGSVGRVELDGITGAVIRIADGVPDPSFGTDGVRTTAGVSRFDAVAVAGNGTIVAVGADDVLRELVVQALAP